MRLGGVVLATILTVGACSSEPAPKEPPRSPTPTATTPAVSAPIPPAQASENSPEGAAAFVNHYIDVFNYAASTGDVERLSELSSPNCTGCQRYIKLYRDTYKAGGYFKGGDWKPGEIELAFQTDGTSATTRVRYGESLFKRSTSQGEQVGASGAANLTFSVTDTASSRQIAQLVLAKQS